MMNELVTTGNGPESAGTLQDQFASLCEEVLLVEGDSSMQEVVVSSSGHTQKQVFYQQQPAHTQHTAFVDSSNVPLPSVQVSNMSVVGDVSFYVLAPFVWATGEFF